jgi:hypothetical protein
MDGAEVSASDPFLRVMPDWTVSPLHPLSAALTVTVDGEPPLFLSAGLKWMEPTTVQVIDPLNAAAGVPANAAPDATPRLVPATRAKAPTPSRTLRIMATAFLGARAEPSLR